MVSQAELSIPIGPLFQLQVLILKLPTLQATFKSVLPVQKSIGVQVSLVSAAARATGPPPAVLLCYDYTQLLHLLRM
jgi:hypothetical protein